MARETKRRVVAGVEVPKPASRASTKDELLVAYEEVVSKLEDGKEVVASPIAAKEERQRKETVVQTAAAGTVETLVKGMADLKLQVASALDDLTEKLVASRERLAGMQEAIGTETARLKELYDINVAADSLEALVAEYRDKKKLERELVTRRETEEKRSADERSRFELEMAQMREAWNREQESHAAAVREREGALKKLRDREEEEYTYQLQRNRQKDADQYKEKQAALHKELAAVREKQDRELAERERILGEREAELARMKQEAEAFPKRLEEATTAAAAETKRQTEERLKAEVKLTAKEAEAAANVSRLRIEGLEKMVEERNARLADLQVKLEQASAKVSEIAIRAIEGASGTRALQTVNEIALEQAKHVSGK